MASISKALIWIDRKLDFLVILYLFLGLFWLLNGFDKFFNGENIINFNGYATGAAIVDSNGTVAYTYQPTEPNGWFGVNRDEIIIGYFARLGLPSELALGSLYFVGVIEIILLYYKFLEFAQTRGVSKQPYQTTLEFRSALQSVFNQNFVKEITDSFNDAFYGAKSFDIDTILKLENQFDQIRFGKTK